jgi:hypothetical protein
MTDKKINASVVEGDENKKAATTCKLDVYASFIARSLFTQFSSTKPEASGSLRFAIDVDFKTEEEALRFTCNTMDVASGFNTHLANVMTSHIAATPALHGQTPDDYFLTVHNVHRMCNCVHVPAADMPSEIVMIVASVAVAIPRSPLLPHTRFLHWFWHGKTGTFTKAILNAEVAAKGKEIGTALIVLHNAVRLSDIMQQTPIG